MGMVQVVNRGSMTYREKFKEEMIVIKPGQAYEMDRDEAILFLSQPPTVMKLDVNDDIAEESKKNLWIDPHQLYGPGAGLPTAVKTAKAYRCEADGAEFDTEAELNDYIREFHAGSIVVDDKSDGRKVLAEKKEDDEKTLAQMVKGGHQPAQRRPGRPPLNREKADAIAGRIEQANDGTTDAPQAGD